jgi:hypothetical protein
MVLKQVSGYKLDVTKHELRYRVHSPAKFNPDSFRRKRITNGVSIVIACPEHEYSRTKKTCKVGTQVQAFRFNREQFTSTKAVKWIQKHSKIK